MYDSLSRKAGEPHMIDFVELASSVENYIFIVFSFAELASSVVIEVNHSGFIIDSFISSNIEINYDKTGGGGKIIYLAKWFEGTMVLGKRDTDF